MPFRSGHMKHGGRKLGTSNKLTGEAREVARRLLGDPAYQQSLRERLSRGQAPRIELYLWELAFGRPRAEPEVAPGGAGPSADLVQILEKLGEPNGTSLSPHLSRSLGTDPRDTEED